jgi:membrane protein implicated in regulation of membrane protease activity
MAVEPGRKAEPTEVGVLSADRWGVGSLVTIGALLVTGSLFFFRWMGTRGGFSLTMVLLGGGGVLIVVKATENIERIDFRGYDPVGKDGVVTVALGGRTKGSVRVDGLEWSASSKENLEVGEKVLVVGRDGLHVTVEGLRQHSTSKAA